MKQLKSELAKISESTFFISTKSGAPNERRKQSAKKVEKSNTSSQDQNLKRLDLRNIFRVTKTEHAVHFCCDNRVREKFFRTNVGS